MRPTKDFIFLEIARINSKLSHDPNTRVGAVIVGPDQEIRSTGFNGFPRGFQDDLQKRLTAPEKYKWMVHAEMNAILNAVRVGVSLKNCHLYVTIPPCYECAKGIIQAGIASVTIDDSLAKTFLQKGKDTHNTALAKEMLEEGGVMYNSYWMEKSQIPVKIGGDYV